MFKLIVIAGALAVFGLSHSVQILSDSEKFAWGTQVSNSILCYANSGSKLPVFFSKTNATEIYSSNSTIVYVELKKSGNLPLIGDFDVLADITESNAELHLTSRTNGPLNYYIRIFCI